ncbi:MAG: DnaJ domain-containing protein [Halioglobus sp.]
MPRLILLMAIAAVIYILYQRASALPPHLRKAQYIKLGVGVAVVVVIGLTIAGKMHWLGAALTGLLVAARQLLPTLVRLFPMLASFKSRSASGGGQHSTVETDILRMQLDHESGALEGDVLLGQYQGWHLTDMDKAQLQELMQYCQQSDQSSVQLLDSYLQQRFPGDTGFQQGPAQATASGPMNRKEALDALGLNENSSKDEIVAAHRKLMQKIHPDRGGNDYLAAKINQAKDILLG